MCAVRCSHSRRQASEEGCQLRLARAPLSRHVFENHNAAASAWPFSSPFNFRLRFNAACRSREQADGAQRFVGEVAPRVADGLRYVAHDLPEVPQLDSRGVGSGLRLRPSGLALVFQAPTKKR